MVGIVPPRIHVPIRQPTAATMQTDWKPSRTPCKAYPSTISHGSLRILQYRKIMSQVRRSGTARFRPPLTQKTISAMMTSIKIIESVNEIRMFSVVFSMYIPPYVNVRNRGTIHGCCTMDDHGLAGSGKEKILWATLFLKLRNHLLYPAKTFFNIFIRCCVGDTNIFSGGFAKADSRNGCNIFFFQ